MPSKELTELLDLVAAGRAAMQGRTVGIEEQRARYRKLATMMPLADGVSVAPTTVGGVPAERHVPDRGDEGAAVVYLHGGGYCIGGAETHRPMCAHLATALGCPVVALDYRLAPEHAHPAARRRRCRRAGAASRRHRPGAAGRRRRLRRRRAVGGHLHRPA